MADTAPNKKDKAPLSFAIDSTGLLIARRLRMQQALIVAASLMSRLDRASASAPADLRPRFDAFGPRLTSDVEAIAAAFSRPDDAPAPEPPPEVLTLVGAEVATSPKAVNHDIDNRVGIVMNVTRAFLRRDPSQPKSKAAHILEAAFFEGGLNFLKLSGPLQWLAVQQRFEQASPDALAAAQTLGVDDVVTEVQVMNNWFGKLLGITEAPDETPEESSPDASARKHALDRLHNSFADLLSLSQIAFPRDLPSSQNLRLALLSPYLSAIQTISDEIGQRMRDANKDKNNTTA